MQHLYMYMCDTCGHAQSVSGMCPKCEILLTIYTKETQPEYQRDRFVEESMRLISPHGWSL